MTICKYNPFQATARAITILCDILRSSHWRSSMEKFVLEFSQNSKDSLQMPNWSLQFLQERDFDSGGSL